MQIVIPMVGDSNRFKKSGYKVPKFLLKINNRYIIKNYLSKEQEQLGTFLLEIILTPLCLRFNDFKIS